jgi:hypothetical protein
MLRRAFSLVVLTVFGGCGPSREMRSVTAPGAAVDGSPAVSLPAAARASVLSDGPPVVLAAASDLQVVTAIAVDQGYLYFTGGRIVPVAQDAPEGSDTIGVLRRAPLPGGATEQLWSGQGVGYAVASSALGISFVTYDYATRGRTGTVRMLDVGGAVRDLAQWRSQGSSIALASDDTSVFWSHTSGASGEVERTASDGSTQAIATDQIRLGVLAVRGGDLFWTSGPSVLRAPKAGGPVASIWSGAQDLAALATTAQSADLVVVDDDALVAIDTSTLQTRILGSGYRGTGDLFFDGQVVYATNSAAGTVTALSVIDGQTRIVASGQSKPSMVIADATAVYWINAGLPAVMTAPK